MSTLTEELEENDDDEDAAIVELVAAIVSVTNGSDTMKNFVTQ